MLEKEKSLGWQGGTGHGSKATRNGAARRNRVPEMGGGAERQRGKGPRVEPGWSSRRGAKNGDGREDADEGRGADAAWGAKQGLRIARLGTRRTVPCRREGEARDQGCGQKWELRERELASRSRSGAERRRWREGRAAPGRDGTGGGRASRGAGGGGGEDDQARQGRGERGSTGTMEPQDGKGKIQAASRRWSGGGKQRGDGDRGGGENGRSAACRGGERSGGVKKRGDLWTWSSCASAEEATENGVNEGTERGAVCRGGARR